MDQQNNGELHIVWPLDPAGFSTHRITRLRHNFHRHPLFQLPELANLARELMPKEQCRFVRPGMQQDSAFRHEPKPVDGRDIDQVFDHIHESGSWIALYNVEAVPRYQALLEEIIDGLRPLIEREQPGIFNVTGFIFISAPPSVTPFHIDRENNFWMQLHGRKTLSVWEPDDRDAVSAAHVEDFIVSHTLRDVRLKDSARATSHDFDSGPGDGVYFPTTAPHMTRSDTDWVHGDDGVSISIGVTFYTSHTVRNARVHQFNRVCRKYLGLHPAYPGHHFWRDRAKAPLGYVLGVTRQWALRALTFYGGLKAHHRPDEGWWGEKAPPGSY
ncbi:JmjC domain-containing protein [Luteibacter aegosomatissinici]|uniref:JmjC domain-containing protein n=1 Tax=Luteibacter aegosomatissinici TaxID=2911539 RepID=UPI001FFACAA9|nr:cupin domain-containing protein [Luteibacter aegosomatissinici]UPG92439.1 hypothetical protein L2Y97_11205 [Luteibacter aegosomatissinici]